MSIQNLFGTLLNLGACWDRGLDMDNIRMGEFCLKWNDFNTAVSESFMRLREEKDFFDVTLVTEDGVLIEAHKVVLSASSNFFKDILKKMPKKDPFLYLSGMNSTDLNLMMEYIYRGEVTIQRENVDTFLEIAFKLKIQGIRQTDWDQENDEPKMLSEDDERNQVSEEEDVFEPEVNIIGNEQNKDGEKDISDFLLKNLNTSLTKCNEENKEKIIYDKVPEIKINIKQNNKKGKYSEELESILESFMSEKNRVHTCKQCGKTTRDRTNLKEHIETHIEGLQFECDHCNKTFTTTCSLRKHKRICHRKSFN